MGTTLIDTVLRDDVGTPLGTEVPSGAPLRTDGATTTRGWPSPGATRSLPGNDAKRDVALLVFLRRRR